ncbi:MAG: isopentenyl-diphosphate Delta-isomerase [Alphaproteobacteria bacterium]|nr:isopentenyl-diphosphate Delta-isomerase [Alphaproteobacteria bacterium]MDP6565354.1 isopentenyl-diphosphate Delta-isomerase [Alphaproteobacteria bacterium]MDP6815522.1 isopentenyl-diphosphate Delta-isomerase [Alphaproteobacteria bacterium]
MTADPTSQAADAPAEEMIVLVDEHDGEVGVCGKMETHRRSLRHRAFSVIVKNAAGEVLIQRRADGKYHSPGLWANACCGHPRVGEAVDLAASRRLREELGFGCELHATRSHSYCVDVGGDMIENEFVHVFFGLFDGTVLPNADEVSAYRWLAPEVLLADADNNPGRYAPWFRDYLAVFGDQIASWRPAP